MGIFSAFNIGRQALSANQTALSVTGQNIANAGNADYTRQRVTFETTPAQDLTYAQLGTGVRIREVQRIIDEALEARINGAGSQLGNYQAQMEMLDRIESIFNELGESDLSSALSDFYDALDALTAEPNDASTRLELLSAADALRDTFNYIATQLNDARKQSDNAVLLAAETINELSSQIAELNQQITVAENGGLNLGTANDLRDKRDSLVQQMSEILEIRAIETDTGAVNVLAGSDFLVFGTTSFSLTTEQDADRGVLVTSLEFEHNGGQLNIKGGKLAGLIEARDTIAGGFVDDVETLANEMIYQMNCIHVEGRGIDGLSDATSHERVSNALDVLNSAGLNFDIENGSFVIDVFNQNTSTTTSINVSIDLDGIGTDSTLTSVVAEINSELAAAFGGAPPVSASITGTNQLVIESSSDNYTFSFSEDSSGFLAAIGMNTFFTGSNALDIDVSQELRDNTDLITAAFASSPGGNGNALRMAQLRENQAFDNGTASFEDYYQGIVGSLGVQAASAHDRMNNQTQIVTSLLNEHERISGVNLDEETINLLEYQRAYQAAAQLISVADKMLETLLNAL